MLLLEPANKILEDTVRRFFADQKDPEKKLSDKKTRVEVRLSDFDDASYLIVIEDGILSVNFAIPCFDELAAQGALDALKVKFGDKLAATAANGYHVTVNVNLSTLPDDTTKLVEDISLIKSYTVGAVFEKQFKALSEGKAGDPFKLKLRPDTIVYFVPKNDRCTVIFDMDFNDRVDLAIAKVFLQEFAEARRYVQTSPPCTFTVATKHPQSQQIAAFNPPQELKAFNVEQSAGKLGFLSFTLLPTHVANGKYATAAANLQMLRNYLQYHMKCSKSLFHARMRARVTSLLQVLNRAKTDAEDDKKKKTFSGKTFHQK